MVRCASKWIHGMGETGHSYRSDESALGRKTPSAPGLKRRIKALHVVGPFFDRRQVADKCRRYETERGFRSP